MITSSPTREASLLIGRAVKYYSYNLHLFETVAETIHNYIIKDPTLSGYMHSVKYRVKAPKHLRDKLRRKAIIAREKNETFDIDENNLFERVSDLAGVRILHLRSNQIAEILPATLDVLSHFGCIIAEEPFAYTWDDESRDYLSSLGIQTETRKELYTSIHLVVKFNEQNQIRCEIQIRTLMEEVWGEVSHLINYPHETQSIACREQLKVLARVASGGTRLVDSIFSSLEEYSANSK